MQKQQQLKSGLLGTGLLRAGESERSGVGEKAPAGFQRGDVCGCCLLRQHCTCDLKKSISETMANPAAKGHREHRLISETELGRKSFNPDWDISREL